MKKNIFISIIAMVSVSQMSIAALPELAEITPQAKAQLSDKILSMEEISHGADETQNTYVACLTQTNEAIKNNFPNANQDILMGIIGSTCTSHEDLFNVYNILLASSNSQKPMSELQAAEYLEQSYKTLGRENANSEMRIKILKLLNIVGN